MKNIILTKYKKIIILSLIFAITLASKKIAFSTEIKESSSIATVIKVIDGDTMQVALPSKKTAYVSLKGISTKGYDDSFSYLTNNLLGKTITLIKDNKSYNGSNINYMLVYYNGENINQKMLELGLASIDNKQDSSYFQDSFIDLENIAKDELKGMWKYSSDGYSSIDNALVYDAYAIRDRLNINTASKYQIDTMLYGVSSSLAKNIVRYRQDNPISSISELKFIDGFTNDIYIKNKNKISVYTNINTATPYELETLNLSNNEINNIINKREYKAFKNISEVSDFINRSNYYAIKDFISTKNLDYIDYSKNKYRANISVSSKNMLIDAGLSYSDADFIIKNRDSGYSYKTIEELTKISGSTISIDDINRLSDNLNVMINLNSSNRYEISSVIKDSAINKVMDTYFNKKEDLKSIVDYSHYDTIKNVVYAGKMDNEYININTASKSEITSAGISSDGADKIISKRPIKSAIDIPIYVHNTDDKISLYTNINNASIKELMSLDSNITNSIADKIIRYRKYNGGFGSLDEVYRFFKQYNLASVYNDINDYIVLR